MITPIWNDSDEGQSEYKGTRYRLRYAVGTDLDTLVGGFENLPKTIILALRKMCRLEVHLEGVYNRTDFLLLHRTGSLVLHRPGDFGGEDIQLETRVSGTFGRHKSHFAYFRPFSKEITNLVKHKLRPCNETIVRIAFEVDGDGKPVIPAHGQHVFAYLPVQQLKELPFVIQAKFVLAANREQVSDIQWNQALRKGVAATFAHAIDCICDTTQSLKFTWMRMYPADGMGGIWEALKKEIDDALGTSPILVSRKNELRCIPNVRSLPEWFCKDDEPILPDTTADVYLSGDYSAGDIKILHKMGLQRLTKTIMVKRLEIELNTGRTHERPLDDDWQTAFTNLLTVLDRNPSAQNTLDSLAVIPLSDGRWVSPRSLHSRQVYLPVLIDDGDLAVNIPDGLPRHRPIETRGRRRRGSTKSIQSVKSTSSAGSETATSPTLEQNPNANAHPHDPGKGTFLPLVPSLPPQPGQRLVYVDGGFYLFSSGHIAFLETVTALENDLATQNGNWNNPSARDARIASTGSDYPSAYLIAGIHADEIINAYRGLNYPIMNLYERGLCLVQCRYVHSVVFCAPYTPSKRYLASLPACMKLAKPIDVVYHGPTAFLPSMHDPFADAKALGVFCETPEHRFQSVNSAGIVKRILDHRAESEERQRKKAGKAVGEEEAARREKEEREERERRWREVERRFGA